MLANDNEVKIDIDIWMPFMKALVKKYGNFKISQELHNMIIEKLYDICWQIENNKE